MGIAVGKKCRACGAKCVLVRYSPTRDRLRYECSACDHVWIEKPLHLEQSEVTDLETLNTLEFFAEAYIRRTWDVELKDTLVVRAPSSLRVLRYTVPYREPVYLSRRGRWARVQRFFGRLLGARSWGTLYRGPCVAETVEKELYQLHLYLPGPAKGVSHYMLRMGYVRESNILVLSEFRLV